MPVYEYRCPTCHQTYERFYMVGEAAAPVTCPVCAQNCPKVPSLFRADIFGVMEADRASRSTGLPIESRSDLRARGLERRSKKEWEEMKMKLLDRQNGPNLNRNAIRDGMVEGMKRLENRDFVREINTKLMDRQAEATSYIGEGISPAKER